MSRNYKFHNPEGLYFVSFQVVEGLDVFIRNEYKDILLQSFSFCQKEKLMEIIAWCIMTNHFHLTKKAAAKSSNVKEHQFWRHDNKPVELWSNVVIWEE